MKIIIHIMLRNNMQKKQRKKVVFRNFNVNRETHAHAHDMREIDYSWGEASSAMQMSLITIG